MEYFTYIIKFLYKIKWWLLIVPIIAVIIAAFLTKNMNRSYDVNTTIYTGVISGYSVESTTGAKLDFVQQSTTMDNIINLITAESTLKRVSLRLYAQNMMYGNPKKDNNYITAANFNALLRITPPKVRELIDKTNEKKTIANLMAYEKPDRNNFIFGLFYWNHPHYCREALQHKIKVDRIGSSDMIDIKYSADDPGIAYNTLKILNEEFVEQYQDLRFGETNDVIKFFENEVAKLSRILKLAEDSLTTYNIEKRIINYPEQTKQVTILNSGYETKYEDFLLDYNSAKSAVFELEKRIDGHIKSLKNNSQFISKLQNISNLTSKITSIEVLKEDVDNKGALLSNYKKMLKGAEDDFTNFADTYSSQKYTKENLTSNLVVEEWLGQLIKMEKAASQLNVMDSRKGLLDEQYTYFSPIGSTLKRKERNIGFIEQNYMSMLNSLNTARLRQKNLQMTSATLKIMNPPAYPISPLPTQRRAIVMMAFFGSLLLTLGYFFLVELIDRTLRDKTRTEKLTGGKVIGAYPHNLKLWIQPYIKTCNLIAIRFLSNSLLCYLDKKTPRIVNLISTEAGDGKSFIGEKLEEYWVSLGINVKRLTWHDDFDKDSKSYLLAEQISDLYNTNNEDIYIIEYPSLSESSIPTNLIKMANINLVVTRANRAWKVTDKLLYDRFIKESDDVPVLIYLNKSGKDVLQEFIGILPPYTPLKKYLYRISQLGLTATE